MTANMYGQCWTNRDCQTFNRQKCNSRIWTNFFSRILVASNSHIFPCSYHLFFVVFSLADYFVDFTNFSRNQNNIWFNSWYWILSSASECVIEWAKFSNSVLVLCAWIKQKSPQRDHGDGTVNDKSCIFVLMNSYTIYCYNMTFYILFWYMYVLIMDQ